MKFPALRQFLIAPLALALLSLLLASGTARAGIIYTFSTQLELLSGSDTDNLNDANVVFTAVFADDTTWGNDPLFGFPIVTTESHLWSISGGSTVDGDYTSSTGNAEFELILWQQAPGEFFTGIANFTEVFIHQGTSPFFPGATLLPEHFEEFAPLELLPANFSYWETTDGSRYDYQSNASYSAHETPAPSILWLIGLGLAALFSSRARGSASQPVALSAG